MSAAPQAPLHQHPEGHGEPGRAQESPAAARSRSGGTSMHMAAGPQACLQGSGRGQVHGQGHGRRGFQKKKSEAFGDLSLWKHSESSVDSYALGSVPGEAQGPGSKALEIPEFCARFREPHGPHWVLQFCSAGTFRTIPATGKTTQTYGRLLEAAAAGTCSPGWLLLLLKPSVAARFRVWG